MTSDVTHNSKPHNDLDSVNVYGKNMYSMILMVSANSNVTFHFPGIDARVSLEAGDGLVFKSRLVHYVTQDPPKTGLTKRKFVNVVCYAR